MFPILVITDVRREEQEALAAFGEAYARYMRATPAFFPQFAATKRATPLEGGLP
jgi:protein-S-isoprenylcysteine O-methyltransferase Ste14